MKFELPALTYNYSDLEPYIDALTMETHYSKHHVTYIQRLTDALGTHAEYQDYNIDDLMVKLNELPADIKTKVKNNGGGHYNHSLFWKVIGPPTQSSPSGQLNIDLGSTFGPFEEFKKNFSEKAVSIFGSGWTWLVLNSIGKLEIVSTQNQDCPLTEGKIPILTIDVWEHAYYLKYQNRRNEYIEAWWNVVNWQNVGMLYDHALMSNK